MSDAEKSGRRTSRMQLIRLALIPVLGYVLYTQIVGPLDAVEDLQGTPTTSVVQPNESPAASAGPAASAPIRILENVRELETIASQNPFAVPEALKPQPAEPSTGDEESSEPEAAEEAVPEQADLVDEQWRQAATRWQAQRVSIVFRAGSELLAVVGDQTVRVGDIVEDGVRVAEIRPDGVILEEIRPSSDGDDDGW